MFWIASTRTKVAELMKHNIWVTVSAGASEGNRAEDGTHPELEGNWTDLLEALIPFIDGAKCFQLHLGEKKDKNFTSYLQQSRSSENVTFY